MAKNSSAHYQRLFRDRLRAQGFVKKEIWILPENAGALRHVEEMLRRPGGVVTQGDRSLMNTVELWTTEKLYRALTDSDLVTSGRARIDLLEGSDASLRLEMTEYGDLPMFMSVVGEQILVEVVLWPAHAVKDKAAFNEEVMRTHKLFPLSTISLDTLGLEGDYYQMFGALSAGSILESVVFEIDMLAANVIKATDAYADYVDFSMAETA